MGMFSNNMNYPVVLTTRSPNLDTMPFDVVYEILSWLDYLDYINLGRVSRTLYSLLQNDLLAKRLIKVRAFAHCCLIQPFNQKTRVADEAGGLFPTHPRSAIGHERLRIISPCSWVAG